MTRDVKQNRLKVGNVSLQKGEKYNKGGIFGQYAFEMTGVC